MMRTDALDLGAVGQLMPLHLVIDGEGAIISGGPTMRKLIGPARSITEAFGVERPHVAGRTPAAALAAAAQTGERIFLRQLAPPYAVLRGHAVPAGAGRMIVNLGFGIGLPQSIRQLNLTDADFAPSELAMELLFLHEANSAAFSALSRYNAQLDAARRTAMAESATDPLTGLANRRGLEAALSHALRAARPAQLAADGSRRTGDPSGFGLLQLDLDGFKPVNDRYGHAAGDLLLQHVARLLREETRSGDTASRTGGDEFVLVIGGIGSPGALGVLAERLIARIETPVRIGEERVRISTSIGIVASSDFPALEARQMLTRVDQALYAAKAAGRGCAFAAPGPDGEPQPVQVSAGVVARPPAPPAAEVIELATGRSWGEG